MEKEVSKRVLAHIRHRSRSADENAINSEREKKNANGTMAPEKEPHLLEYQPIHTHPLCAFVSFPDLSDDESSDLKKSVSEGNLSVSSSISSHSTSPDALLAYGTAPKLRRSNTSSKSAVSSRNKRRPRKVKSKRPFFFLSLSPLVHVDSDIGTV